MLCSWARCVVLIGMALAVQAGPGRDITSTSMLGYVLLVECKFHGFWVFFCFSKKKTKK